MPIAQITIIPLGTDSTSLSNHVVQVQRALRGTGVKHQLTPMSTILEGTLDELWAAVRAMHEAGFAGGVGRVSTTIALDDWGDKPTKATK